MASSWRQAPPPFQTPPPRPVLPPPAQSPRTCALWLFLTRPASLRVTLHQGLQIHLQPDCFPEMDTPVSSHLLEATHQSPKGSLFPSHPPVSPRKAAFLPVPPVPGRVEAASSQGPDRGQTHPCPWPEPPSSCPQAWALLGRPSPAGIYQGRPLQAGLRPMLSARATEGVGLCRPFSLRHSCPRLWRRGPNVNEWRGGFFGKVVALTRWLSVK